MTPYRAVEVEYWHLADTGKVGWEAVVVDFVVGLANGHTWRKGVKEAVTC